ncbi:MAG: amidase [Burkholderiaceae bacterium]
MASTPLHELGAAEAAIRLARRDLTAVALVRACLDRIAQREPELHAFACLDADAALAQARALDAGPIRGPLHGLPLGVKDLFDSVDLPTTYGSALYAGHRPSVDAAALALCREAGAVVVGKTVTTEFAYFQPGPTRNPHHPGHTPGGSSSGSAAAVGAAMLPLALGSQTAGSIIRPAAYCGVVGYQASLGRVPRAGIKTLSETLDAFGGFGRSVRDVALLGAVLTGDPRLAAFDAWADAPAPRIAIVRTPEWAQADADVQALFDALSHALTGSAATLVEIELPAALADGVALQKRVMAHEMARALSHERVRHADRLSPRLRALFDEGMAIDGAQHAADLVCTGLARAAALRLLEQHDVLLAPSATGEAPVGLDATGDPVFCRLWTLLGLPCVHLPVGVGRHGLPIGLQAIGRRHDDHRLLGHAERLHLALTR